jgi:hypothetical protein
MMQDARIFVLALAFAFFPERSRAFEPPDYVYSRRIEEAALLAQRAGLPGPYLFGIEITQPSFAVSLTAGDGEFILSESPYKQLVSFVVH